jgi:hypothetical protein
MSVFWKTNSPQTEHAQAAGRALLELPVRGMRQHQFMLWQVHLDALFNSVLARIAKRNHPEGWPPRQEGPNIGSGDLSGALTPACRRPPHLPARWRSAEPTEALRLRGRRLDAPVAVLVVGAANRQTLPPVPPSREE